jgi:hypothetical protein
MRQRGSAAEYRTDGAGGMRIIGVQGEEDAPFPEERDGIRRIALPARRRRPKGPSAFSSTARMN